MHRLSSPLGDLQARYDAVVVGSGYGGAIAASRLARTHVRGEGSRAGGRRLSVCVLERGVERQPGEYPRTLLGALGQVQMDHRFLRMGARTGLYDFRVDRDISVFVGCGLGGTSLVNANVMLRPRRWVLADRRWPEAFREDGELDRGFERAWRMLGPQPYPATEPPLPKLLALERVGARNGSSATGRAPITVSFDTTVNEAGVQERACVACGDCVTGCNHGAKRTLTQNYLPDAVNHGAEIFCGVAVRAVEPRQDGSWLVHFQPVDRARARYGPPEMFVHAGVVVLAAGTLGSTEILLRSRELGYIEGSPKLGQLFSGNGDTLAFAYNGSRAVDGVGLGRREPGGRPVGPTISGVLDERDGASTRRRELVIQEGAIPGALAPVLGLGFSLVARWSRKDPGHPFGRRLREKLRELWSVMGGAYRGAVRNTLTFLTMGHERSSGRLHLKRDRIRIEWPGVGRERVFAEIAERLEEATRRLEGTHVVNPIWRQAFGRRLITVHPLGGCAMGPRSETGVVNDRGQLFRGSEGEAVHPNLYVADGSVVRRSLGVNPLWTISAIAERMCVLLARDRGWRIEGIDAPAQAVSARAASAPAGPPAQAPGGASSPSASPQPSSTANAAGGSGTRSATAASSSPASAPGRAPSDPPPFRPPPRPGLRFTERMKGFLRMDETGGVGAAHAGAEARDERRFEFTATIVSEDLEAMIEGGGHEASLLGTAAAPAVSSSPLTITEGRFHLFQVDERRVDTLLMRYRMTLTDRQGEVYRFSGLKRIHDQPWRLDAWSDLTRMSFTLWRETGGESGARSVRIGEGTVRIGVLDLVRLLAGITPTGVEGRMARLGWKLRFAGYFLRTLFRVYGWPFTRGDVIDPLRPPTAARDLDLPKPERHSLRTADGADIHLERYRRRRDAPPVVLAPGFGTSTFSFRLPTLRTNLAEYLVREGYDVWLLDYRVSERSAAAGTQFTLDDIARHDWPTALERVHRETGRPVHLLGHCVGSFTLLMALLGGHLDQRKVRSVLCSQSFTHVRQAWTNRVKARLRLASIVSAPGFWPTLNPSYDLHAPLGQRIADFLLRLSPTSERCRNPVCRRILFLYGAVFRHDRLDRATHRAVYDMFNRANLTTFRHLSRIVRTGTLVDAEGRDAYVRPENAARIRVPVTLLQGRRNPIFRREGGHRSFEWLREHAGGAGGPADGLVRMREEEFRDYGHMDLFIGRRAWRDVYPVIAEELARAEGAAPPGPRGGSEEPGVTAVGPGSVPR